MTTAARARRHTNITARNVTRLLPTPLLIAIIAVLLVIIGFPLVYIVFSSLNSDLAVAGGDYWPTAFTLGNYVKIWTSVGLAKALGNSIIVSGSVAIVSAVLSLATAYVLVRFVFRGRLTIMRASLGLQSIPGTLLLLPLFVLFSSVGAALGIQIIGTREGLFITYLTFALPFSTWVMITYLRGLPRELEEAARLDGAGSLGVLFRIVLPLSWPGIVVSTVFSFLLGWNDVLFASVLTRPDTQTAAVALQAFGAGIDSVAIPPLGQMFAASLVCAAPVVLLYLVFQRYLISGLTSGGVK